MEREQRDYCVTCVGNLMCIKPAWEDMREDEIGEEQSKCEQYKVINGDTYEKHEEVKCDQCEDAMLKSNLLTGLIYEKHEEGQMWKSIY